jgi:hypothetical protein
VVQATRQQGKLSCADKKGAIIMASTANRAMQVSGLERILLAVSALAELVFGLALLLAPAKGSFWAITVGSNMADYTPVTPLPSRSLDYANMLGTAGHDPYIYQLAGVAILGYAAALAWALLGTSWARMRLLVTATFMFNVGSLYACGVEIAGGHATAAVYVILVASIVIAAITGWLLFTHHGPPPVPDIARWLTWFLVAATLLSVPFALLPLFFPVQFGQYFGFQATDVFIYREGGAALLGYAMLGATEVRSRRWAEIRSAAVMVVIFNTLAAIASIVALANGTGKSLAPIVLPASGVIAVATFVELLRGGK